MGALREVEDGARTNITLADDFLDDITNILLNLTFYVVGISCIHEPGQNFIGGRGYFKPPPIPPPKLMYD
jgi:hypothetical protein